MRLAAVLFLALASACSSILGIDDGTANAIDAGVDVPDLPDIPVVVLELFVDGAGSDANDGSVANPLRSITAAVGKATNDIAVVVRIQEGLFSGASGEVFPIVVPGGSEITRFGEGLIQVDTAGFVFDLEPGAIADNIDLTNVAGDGIQARGNSRLENSRITASSVGVVVQSNNVVLQNNTIEMGGTGMRFIAADPAGSGQISGNTFRDNNVGVSITQDLDFFGNDFSCNSNADLVAIGASITSTDSFGTTNRRLRAI